MGPFYGLIHFNKSDVWVPLIAMALTFALFSGLAEARFRVIGIHIVFNVCFLIHLFPNHKSNDRLTWAGLFTNRLATGLIWFMWSPLYIAELFLFKTFIPLVRRGTSSGGRPPR